jgi:hypothetical protein
VNASTNLTTRHISNIPVQSEDAFLAACLKDQHANCVVRLYQVETVSFGGKNFQGAPENYSQPHYLTLGSVLSKEEALKAVPTSQLHLDHKRSLREAPATAVFVRAPWQESGFAQIESGAKVTSLKTGQQIWPIAPSVRAPSLASLGGPAAG